MDGQFIERNAGNGSDFFSLSPRLSRAFRLTGRVQLEAMVEGFNLTNGARPNAQHELRFRRISDEPFARRSTRLPLSVNPARFSSARGSASERWSAALKAFHDGRSSSTVLSITRSPWMRVAGIHTSVA